MKTELLKHIEILKTIPEIKESIEELKFGCLLKLHGHKDYVKYLGIRGGSLLGALDKNNNEINYFRTGIKEIIGQIHEGHLRMFLKENRKSSFIDVDGQLMNRIVDGDDEYNTQITIWFDNTKPYMEQDEDFFKKLNEWLLNEFKIKL